MNRRIAVAALAFAAGTAQAAEFEIASIGCGGFGGGVTVGIATCSFVNPDYNGPNASFSVPTVRIATPESVKTISFDWTAMESNFTRLTLRFFDGTTDRGRAHFSQNVAPPFDPANPFAVNVSSVVVASSFVFDTVYIYAIRDANVGRPFNITNVHLSTVPEPATYGLVAAGLALLGWIGSGRRRSEA